jgi:hypothetical protein
MALNDRSRLDEARQAARELVTALEDHATPIAQVLMKGQKVARLLRDQDAQTWLHYESNGYPETSMKVALGRCGKYALRFYPDGKMYRPSLPELEARMKATEAHLSSLKPSNISSPIENYVVAGATEKVLSSVATQNSWVREAFVGASTSYQKMRNSIYSYAVDTLISVELGDAAESVFESARLGVDKFVREKVPRGAEQLVAANDRMLDGTNEGRAAALTACRRFLVSVADAVFPARREPYVDSKGRQRKVGPDEYKNRLLAFLESGSRSGRTDATLVLSQLEVLATRFDALNDLVCKGVHAEVTEAEAQLALIETYVFVAQVARVQMVPSAAAPPVPTAPPALLDDEAPDEPGIPSP